MFLIRGMFWVSLVIFFLPIGEDSIDPELRISSNDAMGAAGAAFSDLSQFCNRNADACATGRDAARYFGAKAEYSAKSLYGIFTDRLNDSNDTNAAPEQTTVFSPEQRQYNASRAQPLPETGTPGTNTLTVDDLNVRWDGPGTL